MHRKTCRNPGKTSDHYKTPKSVFYEPNMCFWERLKPIAELQKKCFYSYTYYQSEIRETRYCVKKPRIVRKREFKKLCVKLLASYSVTLGTWRSTQTTIFKMRFVFRKRKKTTGEYDPSHHVRWSVRFIGTIERIKNILKFLV